METPVKYDDLYHNIRQIVSTARKNAYRAVNFAMVEAYWNIGKLIVEEEQKGEKRAEYGKYLIKDLSQRLTKEFGKGFSVANLRNFRQFYLVFPKGFLSDNLSEEEKCYALRSELSWTHYRLIMRVENPKARAYYIEEAVAQNWSTRALQRQINSLYYERLLSSRNKQAVEAEAKSNTEKLTVKPEDFIKDPYILEFLNLHSDLTYLEKDLEQGLIDKLQQFLLELGKGFAFVARQQRISTDTKEFYIDLVFYNYVLKCFVLIDLKTGELTHQDIGQMDMYVRIYEDRYKAPDDNPTIGIILCTERDETVVKYSVLNGSEQLFASKYKLYLPTERELAEAINREKYFLLREKEIEYLCKRGT